MNGQPWLAGPVPLLRWLVLLMIAFAWLGHWTGKDLYLQAAALLALSLWLMSRRGRSA